MKDVYVLSAVRSPIGGFDGSLSGVEPIDLGATIMKEAVIRSGIDSSQISSVVVGNCIPTESRSPYLSQGTWLTLSQYCSKTPRNWRLPTW